MKVRFHLPGFASHFRFNLVFTEVMKAYPEFFREGVEIASFYDSFPQSIWNGGRVREGGYADRSFIKTVIEAFNSRNIPLRFTFTNPCLEKKHLSDKFCNMVMAMANNGFNEVIINSPVLEEYIRKNFPKYKLTSSTCKRITDPERLREELEKDYSIVVLDYDLNNKFDILETLPHKEKLEILVNACCTPNCTRRVSHYDAIGQQQIAYANHVRKYPEAAFDAGRYNIRLPEDCPATSRDIFSIKELSTHVSPDAIWNRYVPMGFNQFKIEGRTLNIFNLLETYIYYMVKPEKSEYARYILLNNMLSNNVLTLNE